VADVVEAVWSTGAALWVLSPVQRLASVADMMSSIEDVMMVESTVIDCDEMNFRGSGVSRGEQARGCDCE
jgi:hypothetical protein